MKKNTIYFYHDKRSLNEATIHYVSLICQSIRETNDYDIIYTNDFKSVSISKDDIILTITSVYFLRAKFNFFKNKHIYWAQGIGPEEYLLRNERKDIKFYIKQFIEKFAVKQSDVLFLVSISMLNHFQKKYKYFKDTYMVMPCYNLNNLENSSNINQKIKNSFVYAGSLDKWQCIDRTIEIFSEYQKLVPSASIKFLVKNPNLLQEKINKYNISNYSFDFVKIDQLQHELLKYEYGFIIRDNNIVNNVATPTKFNSYLSSYVKPIITDVIDDYNMNFKKYESVLIIDYYKNNSELAKIIYEHSIKNINTDKLIQNCSEIFINYYNDDNYKQKIKSIIINVL